MFANAMAKLESSIPKLKLAEMPESNQGENNSREIVRDTYGTPNLESTAVRTAVN